ncbi:MAG: tetratricopeptide (TPR) repeat protein [Paraglaciecola sp.]
MRKILTMIRTLLLSSFLLFSAIAYSQPGWNWPTEPNQLAKAQEKQAFSRVSMQLENYQDALGALVWLYKNNPDLNKSIYIDGTGAIEKIIGNIDDTDRIGVLTDSLLMLFDMRIEYFGEEEDVMNRKAYAAFKQYYTKPAKYPVLVSLYNGAYALNPKGLAAYNITPYMTLAKYYFQRNPEEMKAEMVLDIYDKISFTIDAQMSSNASRMKKEQEKIDALLNSLGEIITCDYIAEKLVPKLNANPNALEMAKKIYNYSLRAKCTDEVYFLVAADQVLKSEPAYDLCSTLGKKNLQAGNLDQAIKYFIQAESLSDKPEDKYDAYVDLALSYTKQEQKSKARAAAYEAISLRPGDKKAFDLVGNLYFTSFTTCKAGESIVRDRSIFIAAYEMYEKAGNADQMRACKEQFPSIEEIFNEGLQVGQEITIDCWVGETVKLARRD